MGITYLKNMLATTAFAAAVTLLSACGGGGGGGGGTPPPSSDGTVTGRVVNAVNGEPIVGAVITVGETTKTSGADGAFAIGLEFGDRIGISAVADGYARTQRIASLSAGRTTESVTIKLLPIDHSESFLGSAGKQIAVPDSPAMVEIAGNSLAAADGTLPTGNVIANVTIVDPLIDPDFMPGDYLGDNGDGVLRTMESYGAMTVTFADESTGERLNLLEGQSATLRIPATSAGGLPATMPLFYYDEAGMKWMQEGTATLVNNGVDEPYYTGTVTHFTTWNADILYDSVSIHGCVVDASGSPVANARVTSTGSSYIGTATAFTDSNGGFTVQARPDSAVLVAASTAGSASSSVMVPDSGAGLTLDGPCLLLGAAQVSIKLTWGEYPLDLDSHLRTPDGTHVAFYSPGALTEAPYANLDVDDVTSFGPEVVTISRLSAGQYQYYVDNWSETFDPGQTGSPARVELRINGESRLFVPPAGEGTNLSWHVFNLNVATNGTVTVSPVGAWLPTTPGLMGDFSARAAAPKAKRIKN